MKTWCSKNLLRKVVVCPLQFYPQYVDTQDMQFTKTLNEEEEK